MHPKFTVSSVSERDIDRLLVEEFVSSEEFQSWFVNQALGPDQGVREVHRVEHSVRESTGQSEVEVTFTGTDGRVWHFVIENRIAASIKPQQVEHHRLRGQEHVERGDCDTSYLVLVAPRRYFGSSDSHEGFDTRVTYESLWEWFSRQDRLGDRRAYKAGLLAAAIERAAQAYQPQEDAPGRNFWRQYWELAGGEAPELAMEEPTDEPGGAGRVRFRPSRFARDIEIVHRVEQGCVDLQFGGFGRRLVELRVAFKEYLDADMQIAQVMKSGAIRIKVPRLQPEADFPEQRDRVQVGLSAAKRLFRWFEDHAASWAAKRFKETGVEAKAPE